MNLHSSFPYLLYLVISEADCHGKDFLATAESAITGGVDIIQLREKNIPDAAFLKKAAALKEITEKHGIPLIINDNVNVAVQVNATGIHVGNRDVPPFMLRQLPELSGKMIGYSVEYIAQLSNGHIASADYLGISPVFKTDTKKDTVTEWGLNGIVNIRRLTDKPLVAIGNMHAGNVRKVLEAGADCVAVVSAICGAPYPEKAAYELKNEILKTERIC